jgi:uncharacterized protein YceH (UPF0502 family)
MRLSREEGRVLGSLIEKQLTTPQQYPLTLNSLLLACNQSSNRDPVVNYEEVTVRSALESLKAAGLVRFDHPSHGRSVTRYLQVLDERLSLSVRQIALLAVMLLRGPQTAAELRSRTESMCDFDDMAHVEAELERLRAHPEQLAVKLARQPGQKEERWAERLTRAVAPSPAASGGDPGQAASPGDLSAQVAELRAEVKELRGEVERLREVLLRVTGTPFGEGRVP